MTIVFSKESVRFLKTLPTKKREKITSTIQEITEESEPQNHPQVRIMRDNWEGFYRLRIGKIRAIFHVTKEDDQEYMVVHAINTRGNIY